MYRTFSKKVEVMYGVSDAGSRLGQGHNHGMNDELQG